MGTELRVALVHDLLVSYGGSEQVLFELHQMFPDAPIYTTIFDPARLPARFATLPVVTSFLQRIPSLSKNYGAIVPLMPLAFRSFDLRGFDLIISSCHAFSKAVVVPDGALHICYCYTPLRYAWSHQDEYIAGMPMGRVLAPAARLILARLRAWDYSASKGVDHYIAISDNVRNRIAKYYGRGSDIVYPGVNLSRFDAGDSAERREGAFLVVSRLFSYKRVDVAVEACTRLRLPLRVVGKGPELRRLRRMAGSTVQFLGEVDDRTLESEYRACRALIFPADEDFGLVPLEAMASGCPVLALDAGGARETVVAGKTGEFYEDGGVDPLIEALRSFRMGAYETAACRARAEEFSVQRFRSGIRAVVERELGRALPAVRVP
jgi:glycosyltransferase involved in cell wall biosynthesis